MNAPQYQQHPPQHGWQSAYPPPRKKNKAWLVLPLVLVLVVGAVAAVLVLKSGGKNDKAATQAIQSDGPADQDVLTQQISAGTVSYGAMAVFEPVRCCR